MLWYDIVVDYIPPCRFLVLRGHRFSFPRLGQQPLFSSFTSRMKRVQLAVPVLRCPRLLLPTGHKHARSLLALHFTSRSPAVPHATQGVVLSSATQEEQPHRILSLRTKNEFLSNTRRSSFVHARGGWGSSVLHSTGGEGGVSPKEIELLGHGELRQRPA